MKNKEKEFPFSLMGKGDRKMGKMIDISSRITNQEPVVKITDEIIVTVNNRKQTMLNIQAMLREYEKKAEEDEEKYSEIVFIEKAMQMLIGTTNAKKIEELNLPVPEYKLIYNTIMKTVNAEEDEETPR